MAGPDREEADAMKMPLPLVALAVCACAPHDREIALVNPGFEAAAAGGETVPGWRLAQHAGAPAYAMSIDTATAASGHASFRMQRLSPQVYGSIVQQVAVPDAARGRSVTLSARMKTQDVGRKGWVLILTIVADAGNRQVRAEAQTGTHDFADVAVGAHLPDDARAVEVSALLLDEGTGWLDDVRLRIDER
jgi:hypothetical protein